MRSSNHHDVAADLVRDIVRKRKIALVLDLKPKSMNKEPDSDSSSGEEAGDEPPPRKRALRLQDETLVGATRLGTRSKALRVDAVRVWNVGALLPTIQELPQSRMKSFHFADRLGVYLTDGQVRPEGEYPTVDDDLVVVHRRAKIDTPTGRQVIRADPSFRGKARYSFVQIRGTDDHWYGQVIALLTFKFRGVLTAVALVNYLTQDWSFQAHCPNKEGFRWHSGYPDCIEVANIIRPVCMVHAAYSGRAVPTFALMQH